MSETAKFVQRGTTLSALAGFELDERQADEQAFLACVDRLLEHRSRDLLIDLVQAGSLSSTVIALVIAAARKAQDKGKHLSLRVAKRNAMAVRISGIDKLLAVELL